MKTMSAREAKNGFGLMIDTARAEPGLIEKHGRGVVVVVRWKNMNGFPCNLEARIRGNGDQGGGERWLMKRTHTSR